MEDAVSDSPKLQNEEERLTTELDIRNKTAEQLLETPPTLKQKVFAF